MEVKLVAKFKRYSAVLFTKVYFPCCILLVKNHSPSMAQARLSIRLFRLTAQSTDILSNVSVFLLSSQWRVVVSGTMPGIQTSSVTWPTCHQTACLTLLHPQLQTSNKPPAASFTKEINSRLAKRPLVFNGRLANRGLISLVKEATDFSFPKRWSNRMPNPHNGMLLVPVHQDWLSHKEICPAKIHGLRCQEHNCPLFPCVRCADCFSNKILSDTWYPQW